MLNLIYCLIVSLFVFIGLTGWLFFLNKKLKNNYQRERKRRKQFQHEYFINKSGLDFKSYQKN